MARLTDPTGRVPGSDPRTGPGETMEHVAQRRREAAPSGPNGSISHAPGSDPGTCLQEALWQG